MKTAVPVNDHDRSVNDITDSKSIELTPEEKQQFFAKEGVDPLTSAFDSKKVIHAGMPGAAIPEEDIVERYTQLMESERSGQCAAYLHIPFCETHCLYCGFYTTPYREGRSKEYTDKLIAELESEKHLRAVQSSPINAVYFGGGTPTSLEPADLKRLLEAVRNNLPLADDCEITIEGRILNFTKEKMQACLDGGANRFSLGVQTFDTDIRLQQGRSCNREEVCNTLSTLKGLGECAVIIDLIYGLPGQTKDGWLSDIDTFIELGLDGVDLYKLNVFPGGRLARAIEKGTLPPAASLKEQAELFAAGVIKMQENNARRLSVTHWGTSDLERNIYNPLMKSKRDCLAFGAGAGGSINGVFYATDNDYKTYLNARENGEKPVVMMMEPPSNIEVVKTLTSQMEKGHLDLKKASQDTGSDMVTLLTPLLSQWERAGLLLLEDNNVTLTLAGEFWQAKLTQFLLNWHKLKG